MFHLADFLLLDQLAETLTIEFHDAVSSTLCYFTTYWSFPDPDKNLQLWPRSESHATIIFDDLRVAVERAYGRVCRREFQQRLAILAYDLSGRLPRSFFERLQSTCPGFFEDLNAVHLAQRLPSKEICAKAKRTIADDKFSDPRSPDFTGFDCSGCSMKLSENDPDAPDPTCRYCFDIVMNPFSTATFFTWCVHCADHVVLAMVDGLVEQCWDDEEKTGESETDEEEATAEKTPSQIAAGASATGKADSGKEAIPRWLMYPDCR